VADSGHWSSQRDEAVAAFEQESRVWPDEALLPGEAEEFAEQHFIAGYKAAAEPRDQRITELMPYARHHPDCAAWRYAVEHCRADGGAIEPPTDLCDCGLPPYWQGTPPVADSVTWPSVDAQGDYPANLLASYREAVSQLAAQARRIEELELDKRMVHGVLNKVRRQAEAAGLNLVEFDG
jgi:hypothetical protein